MKVARPCAVHGCPELIPCPDHKRIPFAGMGHGQRLGKTGWQRQRDNERTMRRHHRICWVCGRPGADRIDHVTPLSAGGLDTTENRRPIHDEPCHRIKTDQERAAGRHPGVG